MNISDCSLKCLQKHMKLKQIFQYPLPILLAGGPHVIFINIYTWDFVIRIKYSFKSLINYT